MTHKLMTYSMSEQVRPIEENKSGIGGHRHLQVKQYYSRADHTVQLIRHKCAAGDLWVRSLDRQPWCSICQCHAHYTRSCRARVLGPRGREIEVIIQSLLCTMDTEPDSQKGLLDTLW